MIESLRRWYKQNVRHEFPKKYVNCELSSTCTFSYPDRLNIGQWVFIGPRSFIECKGHVEIGDGAILSSQVVILSSTHDYRSNTAIPYGGEDVLRPVKIGKAVWIGYGSMILPGVTIGDGAVVGAGSVVTKDIPKGAVVAGSPARVIRTRDLDGWEQLIESESFRLKNRLA